MSEKRDFDARELIDDPDFLGLRLDAADAAALRSQISLHCQRVSAATRHLAKARARGAAPSELSRLEDRVERRRVRLAVVEDRFVAANLVKPDPNPKEIQVFGLVSEASGEGPLTAALLGSGNRVIASAAVNDNGSFLLSTPEQEEVRIQVSDQRQQVLFRDARAAPLELGRVTFREVPLGEPKKEPAPPPTRLTMPNLLGQSERAACAILGRLGISEIEINRQESPESPGLVLSQSPAPGAELREGTKVSLGVSIPATEGSGSDEPEDPDPPEEPRDPDPNPDRITVPRFLDLQIERAVRIAREIGLQVEQKPVASRLPNGIVVEQDPRAGTVVELPETVVLGVSTGRGR